MINFSRILRILPLKLSCPITRSFSAFPLLIPSYSYPSLSGQFQVASNSRRVPPLISDRLRSLFNPQCRCMRHCVVSITYLFFYGIEHKLRWVAGADAFVRSPPSSSILNVFLSSFTQSPSFSSVYQVSYFPLSTISPSFQLIFHLTLCLSHCNLVSYSFPTTHPLQFPFSLLYSVPCLFWTPLKRVR